MELAPGLATAGVRLVPLEEVDSTNARALACARAGEMGPLWITARSQTTGRGRRGRAWVSPPGNLHATLLLTDPAPPDRAAELSFVAALAVHDAIASRASSLVQRLRLKWPNDVLLDGAKVAGILLEAEMSGRLSVVVGIGVNCRYRPPMADYPTADLVGAAIEASDLFTALSSAFASRLAEWDHGVGFAAIRVAWLSRAAGLGGTLRARLGAREFIGRFESIDERGRLLLRMPDGMIEAIAAGEVFPVAAAESG